MSYFLKSFLESNTVTAMYTTTTILVIAKGFRITVDTHLKKAVFTQMFNFNNSLKDTTIIFFIPLLQNPT